MNISEILLLPDPNLNHATTSINQKGQNERNNGFFHFYELKKVRSNSLPSKPHPLIVEVEDHLCRLKASSETTSTSSSSTSQKLGGLCELYDCVEKLLLLPHMNQILVQEISHDELLEGSLRLLDLCDTAKDFLLQTKEFACQLQSALRRRRSEMGFANELRNCLISRKTIKKTVKKVLKGLESKKVENNQKNTAIADLLKDVESVTLEAVKFLLSVIAGSNSASKRSNWSIVSKLIGSGKVASYDEESDTGNEFDMVDPALHTITTSSNKTTKLDCSTNVEHLQVSLKKLESSIQDFEDNLESLCRHLIKIRVSLLNIFNH